VRVVTTVLGMAMVAGVAGAASGAQTPPIYPVADPRPEIAAAVSAARKDGKHVILDFGADWCPDCRVLDIVLKDPAVEPFVRAGFHIVRIDVGRRDKNGDLVDQYRATSGEWIPALVVLDGAGTVIGGTSTDVRFTRRTTPAELVALLERWAPKRKVGELATFVQNGVRVQVSLERDWRDEHWVAASFQPVAPDVHLYSASLPAGGIDGLGRPTRLTLVPSAAWRVRGPVVVDRVEHDLRFEELKVTLPVYPSGPVTLRVPVTISPSSLSRDAAVEVSYMGCSDKGCLPPVIDRRIPVRLHGLNRK
jgi:thiol-disulfide isomerase/thioredoxin